MAAAYRHVPLPRCAPPASWWRRNVVFWWRDIGDKWERRGFRAVLGTLGDGDKYVRRQVLKDVNAGTHHLAELARNARPSALSWQEAHQELLVLERAGLVGALRVADEFIGQFGTESWRWTMWHITARGLRAERWLRDA